MTDSTPTATKEQVVYAKFLDIGMKLGIILLFVCFALYVFGILKPAIPVADLDKYYSLPVHEYLDAITANYDTIQDRPDQWNWLGLAGHGDYLNMIIVAFLAAVTIICYITIIPVLFAQKDMVYTILAVAEVLILLLAASGILGGGH